MVKEVSMKRVSSSERLNKIINIRNLKQSEIVKRSKELDSKYGTSINPNDLSQYLSGKVLPSQKKLSILAEILNTNEVWLMGYDVPMDPNMEGFPNDDLTVYDIDRILGVFYQFLTDNEISYIKGLLIERIEKIEK